MEIVLKKWGNSYGIRLPKSLLDELKIKENDELDISVIDDKIVIKKNEYGEFSIRQMAEKMYGKPFGQLKNIETNDVYDWGEAVGEEAW